MSTQDIVMKGESAFPEGKEMLEDLRSKRIVFLCHCILNSNSKVLERARYGGIYKEVLDVLEEYDVGVVQLPCTEHLYFGGNRYWGGKNVFDSAGYRRFCREQASYIADYISNYQSMGYQIVSILGCDGSPTCGVNFTNHYNNGGGRPKPLDREVIAGKGIFMEELEAEIISRGLKMPDMYGLGMDLASKSMEKIFAEFRNYITSRISAKE
ncbi:MAG: hypothetical protein PUD93_10525 [Lachnospiraceae bacterium]|nr:hypothetical protein [Lachnospiraceae bacterium]